MNRKILGIGIVLAALVSLVLIHRHTKQVAEERLDEFNKRVPNFMKPAGCALKAIGPRSGLGFEVTPSVGLVDISDGTFYHGSAVVRFPNNDQIWEVIDGRARLLCGHIQWSFRTDPVAVIIVLVSLVIGVALLFARPNKHEPRNAKPFVI